MDTLNGFCFQTEWLPSSDRLGQKIAAIDVLAYGKTRNYLQGAVTGLSPYITHGLVNLPALIAQLKQEKNLTLNDKLMFEFAWREFFSHVWSHLREGIFKPLKPGLQGISYSSELPDDIRTACTGVPVIDQSVRQLYATGYLHNHARMWLASYIVHLRKVDWRVGANWLYGHLLDGDLASNYLSWQWIASTFSRKPYLFNADNVAKFAPTDWHSYGSCIDCSYENLEKIATSNIIVATASSRPEPTLEPELFADPRHIPGFDLMGLSECDAPLFLKNKLSQAEPSALYLQHPWMLAPSGIAEAYSVGIIHTLYHQRFPWSAKRWHFVISAMKDVTQEIFIGNLQDMIPVDASLPIMSQQTLHAGYAEYLETMDNVLHPPPRFFPNPRNLCTSFSQFWKKMSSENTI